MHLLTPTLILVWHVARLSLCATSLSSSRIVGGRNAKVGEFPYQVSLIYKDLHGCGGAIVDKRWIVTAGHCTEGNDPNDYLVRVGSIFNNAGGAIYRVLDTFTHPNYTAETGQNDVALVLVEPLTFIKSLVEPIRLERGFVQGGREVVLSGWGTKVAGGPTPDVLQTIMLKTTSTSQCVNVYSPQDITEQQLCTLNKAGEGACHGDSGSPLVVRHGNDRKLVALASRVIPCAQGFPDVHSRVASFIDWFQSICKCRL